RRALREKLGFYVNQRGHDPYNQDAEDLYQEAMTKIIRLLSELKDSSTKRELEDFRLYAWRVAANLCMHFFRTKSPARRRLKDNLRLVLNHHPGFASWKEGGEQLCGFADWRWNRSPASSLDSRRIEEKLADFRYTHVSHKETIGSSLSRTLRELFDRLGAPVEVDTLVNILASVLKVKDPSVVPIDAQTNQ